MQLNRANPKQRRYCRRLNRCALYVAGGVDADEAILGSVEVADPVTGVWSDAAPMATAWDGPAASVMNGKLYVAGGVGS